MLMRHVHTDLIYQPSCSVSFVFLFLIFLSDTLLSQRPFWATVEGKSQSLDVNHCVLIIFILPNGHREPRNNVGSISSLESLMEFETV